MNTNAISNLKITELVHLTTIRGSITLTKGEKRRYPVLGEFKPMYNEGCIAFSCVYDLMDYVSLHKETTVHIHKDVDIFEYKSLLSILEKNELEVYGRNCKKSPMYNIYTRTKEFITQTNWDGPLYKGGGDELMSFIKTL
jgi:hypothetical protein